MTNDETEQPAGQPTWAPPSWPGQPRQPAPGEPGYGAAPGYPPPHPQGYGQPWGTAPARRGVRAGLVAALSGVAALAIVAAGGLGFGLGRLSITASHAPSAYSSASGSGDNGSGGTTGGSGGSGSGGSSGGLGGSGGSSGGSGSGLPGYGMPGLPGTGGGYGGGYAPGTGGTGGGSGSSHSSTGPAASAKQSVGVVIINTNLKYEQAKAAGTGIILTSNGEVLTNNHVIEDATSIKATVASTGKTYTAKVVGTDATDDVAVLQLAGASGLSTVRTASTSVKVGAKVVGVGNAGGTGRLTAAAGRVTGLHKSITTQAEQWVESEHLTDMIATNADIQAGDSGGPLYNAAGQVVGIDTAGSDGPSRSAAATSRAGSGSGSTGLAIPIAKALTIAERIESGKASATIVIGYPAFLGVEVADSSQLTYGQQPRGAAVGGVLRGTPAAKSGLAAGDVITKVGHTTIRSAADLSDALAKYRPGQSVAITWVTPTASGSHAHHATVTLMAGPAA